MIPGWSAAVARYWFQVLCFNLDDRRRILLPERLSLRRQSYRLAPRRSRCSRQSRDHPTGLWCLPGRIPRGRWTASPRRCLPFHFPVTRTVCIKCVATEILKKKKSSRELRCGKSVTCRLRISLVSGPTGRPPQGPSRWLAECWWSFQTRTSRRWLWRLQLLNSDGTSTEPIVHLQCRRRRRQPAGAEEHCSSSEAYFENDRGTGQWLSCSEQDWSWLYIYGKEFLSIVSSCLSWRWSFLVFFLPSF